MLKAFLKATTATSVAVLMAGTAWASDFTPGVVYDVGSKFDKSFNEAAYNGLKMFQEETGITNAREFEVQQEAQREQAMRNFARRGADHIVTVGFSQEQALTKVAAEFPDIKFTIIDAVVDLPNVQSIVFKEQEGSYLVGVLAALHSESGNVGFIGGMDIPLIRAFACGYKQGVLATKADATVEQNMVGTTPSAWVDPIKAGELARSQMSSGVDVIYAAAGGSGEGAAQAAVEADNYFIGVDSNQNHLYPGKVLTSMLKRVDIATFNAFKSSMEGTWEPGVTVLGVAEEGVGWALDEHNAPLISDEMKAAVDAAREAIISGEIEVHDYRSDNSCPV